MKRLFLYTLITIICTGTSFSQLKVGLRGGFNINSIKVTENNSDRYKISYQNGLGFHFGLTGQLQIYKLFIQPDLIFSTVTHNVTMEDIINNGASEVGRQRFNKFEVPIIAGLKFDNNFKLGAGPIFTKLINTKSSLFSTDDVDKSTVGYQLVAGFDWDKFNIEARYEGNLSKYGSGVRIGGSIYDFDSRTNQFIISMAYYF